MSTGEYVNGSDGGQRQGGIFLFLCKEAFDLNPFFFFVSFDYHKLLALICLTGFLSVQKFYL